MHFKNIKTDTTIPFELHLTTGALTPVCEPAFIDRCIANGAKPLFIELARGESARQPMLTKVVLSDNLADVFLTANSLSASLLKNNFEVKRLKIEIPHSYSDYFKNANTGHEKYFEWHGKINYDNIPGLSHICDKHQAHLSLNSLKGEKGLRFITLREYGTKEEFEKRVTGILEELRAGGWQVMKKESEYCIYDNNSFLDNGWLQ